MSDSQVIVLEEISRKSNIKVAKEQADSTQREYIQADTKARVLEDTVRKVNQKAADLAMDVSLQESPRSILSFEPVHLYFCRQRKRNE